MTLEVYGIPNCSTCKKAQQWLDAQGVSYRFINTKTEPPSFEAIGKWIADLGNKPLRNTSGQSYRALGEARNQFTDGQWQKAFSEDAMLLKRPLFVKDGTAVLTGFRAKEDTIKAALGI